jgi:hypothetical protein
MLYLGSNTMIVHTWPMTMPSAYKTDPIEIAQTLVPTTPSLCGPYMELMQRGLNGGGPGGYPTCLAQPWPEKKIKREDPCEAKRHEHSGRGDVKTGI